MDRRPPGGLTTSGLRTEAVNRDEYGRLTLLPLDGEWVEAVAWGADQNECGVVVGGLPWPEGRRRGVRLDVRMAVRVDAETLLASVGDVSESGRECLVNEAWEIFETQPREVGSALAEVRLRLCRCTTACR